MYGLIKDKLPQHIAVIMDGNGRWAQKRRLPRVVGHRRGIDRAREMVEHCLELGIGYLTLYAFSKENWGRPSQEVSTLMSLLDAHLKEELPSMMEKGIRFRAIGDLWELSEALQDRIRETEDKTKDNNRITLSLALSYGGRAEILEAVRKIASDIESGVMSIEDIDEGLFSRYLYTSDMPDPDLLIRTSGEQRISNFLLWQSAYTELYITDVLWPDFTKEELIKAIRDYQQRERRFGLTGEQLRVGVK